MSTSSKTLRPAHRSHLSHPTSLLDRHKSTLRKIDSLKAKLRLRESSNLRSTPKINKFSKKLLHKSESLSSYSRMEKTQQVLSKSRFMPKNIKLSLFTLQKADLAEPESASKPDQNCFTITSQRSDSPMYYPSLIQKARPLSKNKSQKLPTDIEMRNKLLYSLKEAASTKGFHTEHKEPLDLKDISKRSQFWLMKKKQKIEEAKAGLDVKAKDQCTFRPLLQSKRNLSEFRGSRSKSNSSSFSENRVKGLVGSRNKARSTASVKRLVKPNLSVSNTPRTFLNENPYFAMSSYNKVSPIKMKLTYKHGFNSKIKNKARPMIDYREIRFNSDN